MSARPSSGMQARVSAPREAAGRAEASAASVALGGGVAGPLGNNASNVSSRERARARRSVRYKLRDVARRFQRNVNAKKCGKVPVASIVEIRRRVDDGSAHYHGLVRCGAWHSCPVCSYQIATHRAKEVQQIADAHRATGGGLYLMTLTIPHDQGDRLAPLYQAVADSYRFVRSGASWKDMKARVGLVGEVRALEATVGSNGWYPHLHVLVFTARPLSPEQLDELRGYVYRRWCKKIEFYGYRTPTEEHGVTIVQSHRDDYVAKMGLGDELTRGNSKVGRSGSRTPLQVLSDLAETGEAEDAALYEEWCVAMHGARQLTWSRGLRERYAEVPDKSDQQIVDGDSEQDEVVVGVISSIVWRRLIAVRPVAASEILDCAECDGANGITDYVASTLRVLRAGRWPSKPGG